MKTNISISMNIEDAIKLKETVKFKQITVSEYILSLIKKDLKNNDLNKFNEVLNE